jgi:hypothetical protein
MLTLLTALLLVAPGLREVAAQQPLLYRAIYQAKASGLSASSTRSLEETGPQQFRLSQELEVRVLGARLGTIKESSEFIFQADLLQPLSYNYTQTGVARRSRSVQFDWDSGQATSREDDEAWQLTVTPGVVDRLSFQLLLRQRLLQEGVDEVPLSLVNGDEIESHRYRVVGTEIIETPLGRFDTLRVERIRASDSRRRTIFWLARDWHLLLVKFLQTEDGDTENELLLQEAVIAGRTVTPLP